MPIYIYLDKNTPVHSLNPVTKIFSLVCLFISPMLVIHPLYFFPYAGFLLWVGWISQSLTNIKKVWPFLISMFIVTFLLWTLFHEGKEVLANFGSLTITKESILLGSGVGMRLDLLLMAGIIFLSTIKVEEFALGLNSLGLPYTVCFMLSLAFRLVPVFMDSALTIVQAQKSRGLEFSRGNILQRIRLYVPIIIPIFMTALRKADQMAIALESKGFGFHKKRTSPVQFRTQDWVAIALVVVLNAFYLILWKDGMGRI